MTKRPTGTVIFLFTDLEGSTRLWARHPEAMSRALQSHDSALHEAIESHRGYVFNKAGDGFAAAFSSPEDAVLAAIEGQRLVGKRMFDGIGSLRVRMALHAGAADERDDDYFGPTVNTCARLLETAGGGQVVCSEAVVPLLAGRLPPDVDLVDLGDVRLRDLPDPVRAYNLSHPDIPAPHPDSGLGPERDPVTVPLTSFVGRQHELAQVLELTDETRMVTLVGFGGVGKTRLALEVLREIGHTYLDGAWHVDLSPIADPATVPEAVAKSLAVLERPPESITDTLVDHLAQRESLLLLDNCEHVVDVVSKLTDQLLRGAPDLKIIATSREPLDIPGETTWAVSPMDITDAEVLFLDRARLSEPGLELAAEAAAAVTQICRRLDGIPLAIELAAARVRVLSPTQIAERLDDRFRLLTSGSHLEAPHHRTLLATMDWSYELLTAHQQRLLRRLAVFRGGFTLEAATRVCGFGEIEADDVIPILARLVDSSLVDAIDASRTRYRLLETVRQYGARKAAESVETDQLSRRHAEYFLDAGPGGQGGLPEPGARLEWFSFRDTEYDNYRAALEWAIGGGDLKIATGLAIELGNYWLNSGCCVGEGDRWLQTLLERLERVPSPDLQRVLTFAAMQAAATGRIAEAESLAAEVDAVAAALGDETGVASALTIRASLAEKGGHIEEAARLAGSALEIAERTGDSRVADKLFHLVQILIAMGRSDEAEALLDDPSVGRESEHMVAVWRGIAAYSRGELEVADQRLRTALDSMPAVIRGGIMFVRLHLAKVALALGETGRSAEAARGVVELCRRLGDPINESEALAVEAEALLESGDIEGAFAAIRGARRLLRHTLSAPAASTVARVHGAAERRRAPDMAVKWLGVSEALMRALGAVRPLPEQKRFQREVNLVEADIGSLVFSAQWKRAAGIDMNIALDLFTGISGSAG